MDRNLLPFAPGALVGGRFEIRRTLGRGAMGTVMLAFDRSLGREVAIKRLTAGTMESQRRFDREAEVCARISHPNVIRIFGTFSHCGLPCIVYELVEEGETLGDVLRAKPLEVRLELLEQAAAGVGAAHECEVIHRDLKPANVLVRGSHALVTDFGLAWISESSLTKTGQFLGTPFYMAPEQLDSASDITPAVDVWALGVMLFEALYDYHPFSTDECSMQELLARIASAHVEVPDGPNPALRDLVLRCLEPAPERRPQDANAFLEALQAARRGGASRFRLLAALRLPRAMRRLRWSLVGAVATVAGVAGLTLAAFGSKSAPAGGATHGAAQSPSAPQSDSSAAEDAVAFDMSAFVSAIGGDTTLSVRREAQELLNTARRSRTERQLRAQWVDLARSWQVDGVLLPDAVHVINAIGEMEPRPVRDDTDSEIELANRALLLAGVLCEPENAPSDWASAAAAQSTVTYLNVLESLIRAGLRPTDREQGAQLVNAVTTHQALAREGSPEYWWFLLAAVKLDLAVTKFPTRLGLRGPELERPWSKFPDDPWERLLELRVGLAADTDEHSADYLDQLSEAMRDVQEELGPRLGPQQSAMCTIAAYRHVPPEEALGPLRVAEENDPTNILVQRALTEHLGRAKRWREAREHAERALKLFENAGLRGKLGRVKLHAELEELLLEALCATNERELARATLARMGNRGNDSARLVARYPWLED